MMTGVPQVRAAARRIFAITALVGVVLFTSLGATSTVPAGAQTESTSTTVTTVEDQPLGGIIPKPNTGTKPQDLGDRGGAGQVVLFVMMTGFMAAIFVVIARSTAKNTRQRAAQRTNT